MSTAVSQNEMFKNDEMSANPYFGLSLPHLADIRDQLEKELASGKRKLQFVEQAIENLVAAEVERARRYYQKPEGVIHVAIDECDVKHTLPKKVSWDQKRLAIACDIITKLGYDIEHFGFKKELKLDEKAWAMLPVTIAEIVRDARTLEHGKPKIEITPTE